MSWRNGCCVLVFWYTVSRYGVVAAKKKGPPGVLLIDFPTGNFNCLNAVPFGFNLRLSSNYIDEHGT